MEMNLNSKLKVGDVLFDLNKMGEIVKGIFIERPNRFIGNVLVNGEEKICHISDTGRLKEILTEKREIILSKNPPHLKTDYKLIACLVEHYVLINTSIHSQIAKKAIEMGLLGFIPNSIQKEVKYGNSRLDFLIDNENYIELKGSNLLDGNTCKFPDAPTVRGKKHLDELIELKQKGFQSTILIVSMRECEYFIPFEKRDPEFAKTFKKALNCGVKFKGFKVKVNHPENKVVFNGYLKLGKI